MVHIDSSDAADSDSPSSPVSAPIAHSTHPNAAPTPALAFPPAAATLLSVAPTPRPPAANCADRNRLFITGAGLSRTGTETLTAAMDILGLRAYHGGKLIAVRGIIHEGVMWWPRAVPDFERLFDSRPDEVYSATFDIPSNSYVTELMQRYPNYRVVLSKRRSAEEWAESMMQTSLPVINYMRMMDRMTLGQWKPVNRAVRFADTFLFPGAEPGVTSENVTFEKLVQLYNTHLDRVRKLVPADRLIEFHAGEGWEPLCKGLNMPVPRVAFPRKNERNGFQLRSVWTCWKSFTKNHVVEVFCVVVAVVFFWYMLMLQVLRMF